MDPPPTAFGLLLAGLNLRAKQAEQAGALRKCFLRRKTLVRRRAIVDIEQAENAQHDRSVSFIRRGWRSFYFAFACRWFRRRCLVIGARLLKEVLLLRRLYLLTYSSRQEHVSSSRLTLA